MEHQGSFQKTVLKIALPVTMQSVLQSSFSVIDQVMIGQLGSDSIAGIGLAAKFASIYSVVLAAIASAAGIMISQYMGSRNRQSVARSFYVNMAVSVCLAVMFMALCMVFPGNIMSLYTKDMTAKALAAQYLRILSLSFLPLAVSSMIATMLRCMEAAALPLYASIFALALNTGLNYLLIFGKWIFPEMGVQGAASASVAAQMVSCVLMLVFFLVYKKKKQVTLELGYISKGMRMQEQAPGYRAYRKQYLSILCPLLVCEFMWSLGENVYTAIYGNVGTDACAAMTMTIPVQTIVIGALSGLSQASGILIGKSLGAKQYGQAYAESKKLMQYGLIISVILSLTLTAASPLYVKIYHVDPAVREMTKNLLMVFAIVAPVKVLNMILGGGIIRSGGKTKLVMWVDIAGTWGFGVPLGLLAAFVFQLPITGVYFALSLEECVRLGISFAVFRKKAWMGSIQG